MTTRTGQHAPELVLKAVESKDELRVAHDLMAKVHCKDYFEGLRWMETAGAGYPNFRPEHTRIALWKGEVAGALRITTDTIRLKMGGFGWISTSGRHRHKGIARELIVDTLAYLQRQNYHVSMLFGIPNFYHRFGFATTLADYVSVLQVIDLALGSNGDYRVRAGKPGDIAAMQKIHNQSDGDVACSIVRSGAHLTNRWEQWRPVQVLTDAKGKVAAYYLPRIDGNEMYVDEVGAVSRRCFRSLLHACQQQAIEHHAARIRFRMPPTHAFARYLTRFRSAHETRICVNEGGMMAFVNLGETLESMVPEWESCLAQSAFARGRVEVTLVTEDGAYRIRAHRGAIAVTPGAATNKLSLTKVELMHMLTGYYHAEDVLDSKRRMLSEDARAFLNTVFPKRTPFVWPLDQF